MEKWTQDEAIAFECAREAITDLMAIYTRRIADESESSVPDAGRVAEWEAARDKLADERAGLHVEHHAEIARIRSEYGQIIRAWRAERRRREEAVNFARASISLEGFQTSKEDEDHARRFINGEIELVDFLKVEHAA